MRVLRKIAGVRRIDHVNSLKYSHQGEVRASRDSGSKREVWMKEVEEK